MNVGVDLHDFAYTILAFDGIVSDDFVLRGVNWTIAQLQHVRANPGRLATAVGDLYLAARPHESYPCGRSWGESQEIYVREVVRRVELTLTLEARASGAVACVACRNFQRYAYDEVAVARQLSEDEQQALIALSYDWGGDVEALIETVRLVLA